MSDKNIAKNPNPFSNREVNEGGFPKVYQFSFSKYGGRKENQVDLTTSYKDSPFRKNSQSPEAAGCRISLISCAAV